MEFNAGQKVIYKYDSSIGIITGRQRGEKWEVRFSEANAFFIPADLLEIVTKSDDMIDSFENRRYQGINDLKRIIYRYRLSGELTNIIYSMTNSATQFMPHQFIPVTKYLESYTDRLLIADEVGLGKTIESMYIWEELRVRKNAQRLLIVVPAMLREKWKHDLQQYFSIKATIVSAQNSQVGESLEEYIKRAVGAPQKESFALIISLEGLRTAGRVFEFLEEYKDEQKIFDLVIIDEAHYLRNSNTKSFKAGALLRDVSDGMLLLSATPIQTGSENFFNLLRLLSEEEFYNREQFDEQLEANYPLVQLTSAIDENNSIDTVEDRIDSLLANGAYKNDSFMLALRDNIQLVMSSTENRVEVVQLLRNRYFYDKFVTRTRKRDVIENRTERKASVINYNLSGIEKAFYDNVTQYLKRQGDRTNLFNNLKLIMRQRQMASCMPAALKAWRDKGYDLNESISEEDDALFSDLNVYRESRVMPVQMPDFSGFDYETLREYDTKFQRVLEIIRDILQKNPQEKIVIFSFFRATVDYLYSRLTESGIRTTYIRGGMGDEKNKNINDFRDAGINVLVSTEVGSEGIDLQFAKYEINYDLPWNPMRLEQRIGRIDRIGQASPSIYILNSFCQDTIEDRILNRLYERIQIFKDSIGDLEEILGDVIQDLEIDVFLNDYQTDQDIEKRTEQVEYVIKNNQRINRNLEVQSGMLSAYQNFVLDSIKAARSNYRMITAEELIFTIRDFLNNFYPGSVVENTNNPDCVKIVLSSEARRNLGRYIISVSDNSFTRLDNELSGVLCAFSIKAYETFEPRKYKELVDINHPLIKWILYQIKSNSLNNSGCSLLTIERSKLSSKTDIESGIYTYFIQLWSSEGVRRTNELRYFLLRNDSEAPITGLAAESLITAMVMDGRSFDINMFGYDDYEASIDALNVLLDYSEHSFDKFEKLQTEQNRNMINEQEQYIERTFNRKIQSIENTIMELQLEGRTEQVLRMWRGKLAHVKEDKELRVQKLHDKFDCHVIHGDVAVGVVVITED